MTGEQSHEVIDSFRKYLLSTYYILRGTMVGSEYATVNKRDNRKD